MFHRRGMQLRSDKALLICDQFFSPEFFKFFFVDKIRQDRSDPQCQAVLKAIDFKQGRIDGDACHGQEEGVRRYDDRNDCQPAGVAQHNHERIVLGLSDKLLFHDVPK